MVKTPGNLKLKGISMFTDCRAPTSVEEGAIHRLSSVHAQTHTHDNNLLHVAIEHIFCRGSYGYKKKFIKKKLKRFIESQCNLPTF